MTPFFHGKTEWRNADITFEYTEEEIEEINRCSIDPVYFVEKYGTFLTDKGKRRVNLRDYQKEVLELMGEEYYDEANDVIRPVNQRIILLQSRQTGKCISMYSEVLVPNKEEILHNNYYKYKFFKTIGSTPYNGPLSAPEPIPVYELYFNAIKEPSFLDILLYNLYRINCDGVFNRLITNIEKIKFRNAPENEKLIDTHFCNFRLKTSDGFHTAAEIHRTRLFEVIELTLENGMYLECADNHLVYTSRNYIEQWKHVSELAKDDYVLTETGWSKISDIIYTGRHEYMLDFTIAEPRASYYANGILSHNTTTSSAYFIWYICFHTDRNCFVAADRSETATEIMTKIRDVYDNLPFFIKPGVRNMSEKVMKFDNGCMIKGSSGGANAATGLTLHLLLIDECALIKPKLMNDLWTSVFPTMSSSNIAQVIVCSTPRGRHNKFFDIYDGAVKGTNGFVQKTVYWHQVPGRGPESGWKESQIEIFGEDGFNQEFELSFDVDMKRIVKPTDLAFMKKIQKTFVTRDIYGVPKKISDKILWHPDYPIEHIISNEEELLKRRYLLQVDTAAGKVAGEKGKEDSDWNIINIYEIEWQSPRRIMKNRLGYKAVTMKDCIRFRQVGIYMDQDFDEEESANAAKHIVFNMFKCGTGSYRGEIDNCRIMLEINFNGKNWIKTFKTHDNYYTTLIVKTYHSQSAKEKEQGFKTVGGRHGKSYFCDKGAEMISNRQTIISQVHKVPNCSSIHQLEAFGKNDKGVYEGICMHDDISITCLLVSIALEQEDFISWIEEWFRMLNEMDIDYEYKVKLNIIAQMIDVYVEQTYDDEYSIDDIKRLYGSSSGGFGKLTGQTYDNYGGYSRLMQRQDDSHNYGIGGHGASSYQKQPNGYGYMRMPITNPNTKLTR